MTAIICLCFHQKRDSSDLFQVLIEVKSDAFKISHA